MSGYHSGYNNDNENDFLEYNDNDDGVEYIGKFPDNKIEDPELPPNEYLGNDFEEAINNPHKRDCVIAHACNIMYIPDNIQETQPGQWCLLHTIGGGTCRWYYYYSLAKQHFLMFVIDDITQFYGYRIVVREIDGVPKIFSYEEEQLVNPPDCKIIY